MNKSREIKETKTTKESQELEVRSQELQLQCQAFKIHLGQEEKSANTIQKYTSDITHMLEFLGNRNLSKEITVEYKKYLLDRYKVSSVNSKLVSLNSFFHFIHQPECTVKTIRTQSKLFCQENRILHRKEYKSLLKQAKYEGKEKLAMMMRTLGCTGIRVSELKYLTVESVKEGVLCILNKGKYREILIPRRLREKLLSYAKEHGITGGIVFITRHGNPVDRSNLWRQMKALSKRAGVEDGKVYPHNFRHMFAREYYRQEKDIVKLADLLGHTSVATTRIYMVSTGEEHLRQLDGLNLAG